MIEANVQMFMQNFDLRFTSEDLGILGRMVREAPMDNIKRQIQPQGGGIRTNKPATLGMKRHEGKKPFALIDEFQQLIEPGSYVLVYALDRMGVFVESTGLHAVKQSKQHKEARGKAATAERVARKWKGDLGKSAQWIAYKRGLRAQETARTGPGPNMTMLIGWLEDKGYYFFGLPTHWQDALELRIAKMLAKRVDEFLRVNVERLRSTLGA